LFSTSHFCEIHHCYGAQGRRYSNEIIQWFSLRRCVLHALTQCSVDQLATAPFSLPLHSLSTPSFLDVRISPPGRSYGHYCCEALVRGWVTANMQCAVPLSLLFSFLAPPAMLRTDCLLLCTQRGAGAQPRQQDVRASSSCSLESKSSAFSSLILCSLLLCAISHSMDAMSIRCRCACRGLAWGRRESLQTCSWHFPRHKYAS